MQLVPYNPLRDLRRIEKDFDKILDANLGSLATVTEMAPVNMYEEDGNLITEVSLPNFKKNEIKITADGNMLEINAEHGEKTEEKNKRHYYLRESNNEYVRRLALPEGVNTDQVDATFSNNLLTISMPLTELNHPKTIAIK